MNNQIKNIACALWAILGLTVQSCYKNGKPTSVVTPTAPVTDTLLKYTINIGGNHTWKGTNHIFGIEHDTTYYNISYDRAIIVVNDSTLFFYTSSALPESIDTLHFLSSSETNKLLIFTSDYYAYMYEDYRDTIKYNYKNNTITYYTYRNYRGHINELNTHSP